MTSTLRAGEQTTLNLHFNEFFKMQAVFLTLLPALPTTHHRERADGD